MKILKKLFGILIIIFGTKTIIQMASEESGAGLLGAFIGYSIIMILAIWLLLSADKNEKESILNIKNNDPIYGREKQTNPTKSNGKVQSLIDEQKAKLKLLKDRGVLTEFEYREKIELIDTQYKLMRLKKQKTTKQ